MADEKDRSFTPEESAVITEAVRQASVYSDGKFNNLNGLMVGVVIVTFLGFVAMIIALFTAIVF